MLFVQGRISFVPGPGNEDKGGKRCNFDTMLIAFGTKAADRLRRAVSTGALRGHLVRPEMIEPSSVEPVAVTTAHRNAITTQSERRQGLSGARRWGTLASGGPERQRVKRREPAVSKEWRRGWEGQKSRLNPYPSLMSQPPFPRSVAPGWIPVKPF